MFDAILESLNYIEKNIKTNLSVFEVSNYISYSQFYFSRAFSNITQNSPYNYIMKRKISMAYEELLNTDKKIVDIASEYGFNSHENFIRAFKKVFEITPNQAKKLEKKDNIYLFKSIDEEYLSFLYKLKVESNYMELKSGFFVGKPTDRLVDNQSNLIVLSNDCLKSKEFIMSGDIVKKSNSLAFELKNLVSVFKVFSDDLEYSLRFFLDNFYEDLYSSSYVVLNNDGDCVEFIIPTLRENKLI